MTRYPVRYRPPSRYLRYGRSRRRGSNTEMWVAVGIGVVVLGSAGTKTATTIVHHHATHKQVTTQHTAPRTVPVTSGSERAFITATLADLGAPATSANIYSLASWFPHEYPSWPPWASNNPMSSTLYVPGATVYNTLSDGGHVWNYPSASVGARETALTLADGYYPLITAALHSGRGLCGNPSIAGELLTWSGDGYSGVC